MDPGSYDFQVNNAADVLQYTLEDISGGSAGGNVTFGTVSTVADLKALSGGSLDSVLVLGYWTVGDGGGGLFIWNHALTTADNRGTILQPNSAPAAGRWVRPYCEKINARWFGCRGDSINDDTTFLGFASAYVQSLTNGGTLFFPACSGGYMYSVDPVFGTKVTVEMESGAFFACTGGSVGLTFNGKFVCGDTRAFAASVGAIAFAEGSVDYARPQWKGAKGDGVTDDADALNWAFGLALAPDGVGQYRTPAVKLGSYKYAYSKRLYIQQHVDGEGAKLFPIGDGAQFKLATNPVPTGLLKNACVDCTILLMDGGSLSGVTIVADAALDVPGNAGIWLVNCQENYGKTPIRNCRMDGNTAGRNLNGLTSRFNTTSFFDDVGGSFFANGFREFSCNICTVSHVFFEHIANVAGNKPFEFNTSGSCKIEDVWTEAGGDLINGFTFISCGNLKANDIPLGESTTANHWLNGVHITSCSDLILTNLSDIGITYAHARAYTASGSRIGADPTYDMRASGYGMVYLIENANYRTGRTPHPYGIRLTNTFGKINIGQLLVGTILQITMTSRSGALVAPALDIYRLSGGAYNNRGTLTFANFANAGDTQTLSFNIDASAFYALVPSAGAGRADVEWKYNLVNGNGFLL